MSIRIAERLSDVGASPSQDLIVKVRALRARGVDVIDFGPQGPTPRAAIAAATLAMDRPASAFYTDPRGTLGLREAIAAKLASDNEISADPNTEIVVTVGAKEALFAALLALVGPGDEVVLEDPGYLGFEPLIRLAGATPVPVALSAADGFRLPLQKIRAAITQRTRVLLLCNPHNPTGRVMNQAELDGVAALAQERDLVVLMDEAYEHFVFDGRRHRSLAASPDMRGRTVTVQTVSKVYNMAGWRVGWLAAPFELARRILDIHTHAVTCPAGVMQAGAEAAIRARVGEGDLPFATIVENYTQQRDAMVEALNAIPGVRCGIPEGGYFAFVDVSAFGVRSAEMSSYLLDTAHVACTPGSAFGAGGEGFLRLVTKAKPADIRRGVARIADALAALTSSRKASPR
jgi:aspartate aminotransferase